MLNANILREDKRKNMRIITKEDVGLINKYKDSRNSFIFLNDNNPDFTKDEIKMGLDKGFEKCKSRWLGDWYLSRG